MIYYILFFSIFIVVKSYKIKNETHTLKCEYMFNIFEKDEYINNKKIKKEMVNIVNKYSILIFDNDNKTQNNFYFDLIELNKNIDEYKYNNNKLDFFPKCLEFGEKNIKSNYEITNITIYSTDDKNIFRRKMYENTCKIFNQNIVLDNSPEIYTNNIPKDFYIAMKNNNNDKKTTIEPLIFAKNNINIFLPNIVIMPSFFNKIIGEPKKKNDIYLKDYILIYNKNREIRLYILLNDFCISLIIKTISKI